MSDVETSAQDLPPVVCRRTVLRGAALGSVAIIAACGAERPGSGGTSGPTAGGGGGDGGSEGTVLGPAADVPVGGGVIYDDPQVVVTQPAKGEFKAFSSICTHAGCPVSTVTKTINCNCHGSQYALEDGSVVTGPASNPLAEKSVSVEGADLVLE